MDTTHQDQSAQIQLIKPRFQSAHFERLTHAEKQVIESLATGLGPIQIAQRQGTKLSTIRSHIKSIYGKLGAHSAIEALYTARQIGLTQ